MNAILERAIHSTKAYLVLKRCHNHLQVQSHLLYVIRLQINKESRHRFPFVHVLHCSRLQTDKVAFLGHVRLGSCLQSFGKGLGQCSGSFHRDCKSRCIVFSFEVFFLFFKGSNVS